MQTIRVTALFSVFLALLSMPQMAMALCVTAEKANLRSGPSTKYRISWKVYRDMPLRRLSRKGSWYRVADVDGEKHWIHKNLVTGKYKCAVVKRDKVNLRRGPGTKYGKVDKGKKYEAFKYVRRHSKKKNWAQVKDAYGTYWIHRKLIWVN